MNVFEQLDRLDPERRQRLAECARQRGATEEEVAALLSGLIRPGLVFGHAHATDATLIVERALYRQGAQRITLRVSRESPHDPHLTIAVVEVKQDGRLDV